jgi:hypothetical protein
MRLFCCFFGLATALMPTGSSRRLPAAASDFLSREQGLGLDQPTGPLMSVGLATVTTGFLTVTTGLSYRNCNLARPLIRPNSLLYTLVYSIFCECSAHLQQCRICLCLVCSIDIYIKRQLLQEGACFDTPQHNTVSLHHNSVPVTAGFFGVWCVFLFVVFVDFCLFVF